MSWFRATAATPADAVAAAAAPATRPCLLGPNHFGNLSLPAPPAAQHQSLPSMSTVAAAGGCAAHGTVPPPVEVRREQVVLPTYAPCAADPHPQFIEKRVYQGSSGKVYPLPFIDRIEEQKRDQAWEAVWLDNEFVRLMILPQLGGRIHIGQVRHCGSGMPSVGVGGGRWALADRRPWGCAPGCHPCRAAANSRRRHVLCCQASLPAGQDQRLRLLLSPASDQAGAGGAGWALDQRRRGVQLVSDGRLDAGPVFKPSGWPMGSHELSCWCPIATAQHHVCAVLAPPAQPVARACLPLHACRPQHHRPSTFMPCDVHIEREEESGAVTVWCSEHEPMNRMKVRGRGVGGQRALGGGWAGM